MSEETCKYVSSQGLVNICDIKVFSQEDLNYMLENTKENMVIYVHIYFLLNLANNINKIKQKFILLSGFGDYTNPYDIFPNNDIFLNFINDENIIKWYSQNCAIEHPKVIKMPIGLDYHTLSRNNYYWGDKKSPIDQELELINIEKTSFWEREIICYSNFHFIDYGNKFGYSRNDIINIIPKYLIYYEPTQITRIETWKNQTKYAFLISPFGNGMDCHRTWEAIILGCIVIVKKSPLDILYHDLPVLIVNEWQDITKKLLEDTIINFKDKNFNYNKLTLTYYKNMIFNSV